VKKVMLIIFSLFLYVPGKAQILDTLHEFFKHKYNIDARLESRYSFFNNQLISVTGIRLGVAFQRKLRIGGGLSWLKTDITNNFYQQNSQGKIDTVKKFMKFIYLCYYVDFVFYKTKRWQLSVPIQAGTGLSWFQTQKSYQFGDKDPKYLLLLYEPGITVQYKVFKWAGLGTDVAYRFTLRYTRRPENKLTSPSVSFKLLFWFDQLFYELFPETKLAKKYGPAMW
jgi:hypothetical protein